MVILWLVFVLDYLMVIFWLVFILDYLKVIAYLDFLPGLPHDDPLAGLHPLVGPHPGLPHGDPMDGHFHASPPGDVEELGSSLLPSPGLLHGDRSACLSLNYFLVILVRWTLTGDRGMQEGPVHVPGSLAAESSVEPQLAAMQSQMNRSPRQKNLDFQNRYRPLCLLQTIRHL